LDDGSIKMATPEKEKEEKINLRGTPSN